MVVPPHCWRFRAAFSSGGALLRLRSAGKSTEQNHFLCVKYLFVVSEGLISVMYSPVCFWMPHTSTTCKSPTHPHFHITALSWGHNPDRNCDDLCAASFSSSWSWLPHVLHLIPIKPVFIAAAPSPLRQAGVRVCGGFFVLVCSRLDSVCFTDHRANCY